MTDLKNKLVAWLYYQHSLSENDEPQELVCTITEEDLYLVLSLDDGHSLWIDRKQFQELIRRNDFLKKETLA